MKEGNWENGRYVVIQRNNERSVDLDLWVADGTMRGDAKKGWERAAPRLGTAVVDAVEVHKNRRKFRFGTAKSQRPVS